MTQQAKLYNLYVFSPSGLVIEKTYDMKKIQAVKKQFFKNDIERLDSRGCLVEDEKYQNIIKDCDIYVDEEGISKELDENKMVSFIQKDTGGKIICVSREQYESLPTIVSPLLGYVIAVSKKPIA